MVQVVLKIIWTVLIPSQKEKDSDIKWIFANSEI